MGVKGPMADHASPVLGSLTTPTRLGKFEVLRHLATGGMAEIYLARVGGIEGFEKFVVVKLMRPELARESEMVRLFLDEARLAATLQHPNIAQVYEAGME